MEKSLKIKAHISNLDDMFREVAKKLIDEQNDIIEDLMQKVVDLANENNRLEEENKKIMAELQLYRDVIETF